ncbi:MAG: hypothetical protein JNN04_11270 [Cyclobacteriaceae bacterium]|nr:hypothetical protein [Cyclobacteriaceae bacterium]
MPAPTDQKTTRNYTLWFTVPLALLLALVSLAGLLRPEIYRAETADWTVQATAQDAIDFFLILPVLAVSGLYMHRGERRAEPIWGGTVLYLIYTFIIYGFSVHFNSLFLAYVAILGLSAYAFLYSVRRQLRQPAFQALSSVRPAKAVGIYFLAVAVLFSLLWLADIVPALVQGITPPSLVAAGLSTNPVHVLDLSVVLPGVFIVGLLLIRQHPLGLLFAPVLLVFFVLMDITITVILAAQPSADGSSPVPVMVVMTGMALLSLAALGWLIKSGDW